MIIFVLTNKRGKLIMNTTENNKIIAEFMGLSYCTKYQYEGWYKTPEHNERICDFDGLKYHKDWNSIMPVVEKIRVIDQTAKGDFRTKLLHYQRNNKNIFDASILEGIQFVYTLVVEFIK